MSDIKIKTALISVYDKTGIEDFAAFLHENGVRIIATGSTRDKIASCGIEVSSVEDCTGFPEIMDGRVKTLHPKIHGGLLADRNNPAHMRDASSNGIDMIDMVIVNLYPFADKQTVDNIDIGGPAMLRAAAKNYENVCVISDPMDYAVMLELLQNHDMSVPVSVSRDNAAKTFKMISNYDDMVYRWLSSDKHYGRRVEMQENLALRYGENPHQKAGFYSINGDRVAFEKLGGEKELSYNNIMDADAAIRLVFEFVDPAFAIIKHNNPCGVAVGDSVAEACERAYNCDPDSSFGGVTAANEVVDEATADRICQTFTEVVVAPGYTEGALKKLATKKNLRVLFLRDPALLCKGHNLRCVMGGILSQEWDVDLFNEDEIENVTEHEITEEGITDMLFAYKVCKHVKSNAIVIVKDGAVLGIGAGQMSRVDSVKLAVNKAKSRDFSLEGSFMASDAFFPFADSIEIAHSVGVAGIIQPGGSIRDGEVIEAANKFGISMLFTAMRHFKH